MAKADRSMAAIGLVIGALLGVLVAGATGAFAGASGTLAVRAAVLGVTAERVSDETVERLGDATVSVASNGCGGSLVGSGVVTSGGLLVTAGHVTGGSRDVTVSNGVVTSTASPVMASTPVDVASAPLPRSWPALREADTDPAVGATVLVATRARGVLRIRAALVEGYVAGADRTDPGRVMRLDLGAEPGDSGGPVVDTEGRLVGIVYLRERITGRALVVPVTELGRALGGDAVAGRC